MKFVVTMNMPSKAGNLVHQLTVGHPARSLQEFIDVLCENDFVIVDEFYTDNTDRSKAMRIQGPVAINYRHIGKVKEIRE